MSTNTNAIYIELGPEALTDGKWFDGFAVGEFTDMWGSDVEVRAEDLDTYLNNTLAGILATETESGEIVGLPIDSRDHNRGEAAGWIIDARRQGDKLQFLPKWTKIGVELIDNGIMRFFSATFNLKEKVVVGGTLTNWPATRDEKENILLRPIELSRGIHTYQKVEEPDSDPPEAVAPVDNEATPVPVAPETNTQGVDNMVDFSELTNEQRASLMAQAEERVLNDLVTDTQDGNRDDKLAELRKQLDLSAFADVANIDELSEKLNAQVEALLIDQVNRLEAQAGRRMAQLMAEMKRKSDIAEFCQQAVGGTDDRPKGLPIQEDELVTFMASLSSEQYKAAKNIFGRILDGGLNDFAEIGHGRELEGLRPLPDYIRAQLDAGVLEVKDLSNPILNLGAVSEYDLSAYQEAK